MLSRKCNKARYSTDPNGKLWADNPDNFGRKMLQKMGWEPGKGLGKNNSGITAPIKASTQKGKRGLGLKSDFSLGIRQIDDYANLLRALNKSNSSPDKTNSIGVCLSTKSRRGMKMIRAKDASKYNEKDLSVVLGYAKSHVSEEKVSSSASINNSDAQFITITSSLSTSEYFEKAKKRKHQRPGILKPLDVISAVTRNDVPLVNQSGKLETSDLRVNNCDNQLATSGEICENQQPEDSELPEKLSVEDEYINRKPKIVETINAGENIINSVFIQSNLLSIPGYCHY
uniref:G-patch domain-containing protein n=1 Tax=Trichobilharzia regenti TaxID=157069 RepID=A0AA85KMJ3_TRIRE|nr:unnamed protein product [Trichobilharzia regenti]